MEDDVIKVIYRHYATLYFVFIVDEQESELGILDLIQVFVESLDRCFENVCELDLVFGWQVLQTVLGEIIQGGMVIETSINKIVAAVDDANRAGGNGNSGGTDDSAISKAFSNATSALQAMTREGRIWPSR
ncbi:Aps3p [Sugiyamaella lignohabitans]|uniref:Aps3p n=1 Tax=Sugiyamaella lignohabitans TaxID=796027 RepID=A0A167DWN3_9ASCO|nr:Aps3p [Sugiyamaella lignohabitans]ANB13384.1 Aps3p [Sugiyamaella lignohabitans]